jgi:hypothetical protein
VAKAAVVLNTVNFEAAGSVRVGYACSTDTPLNSFASDVIISLSRTKAQMLGDLQADVVKKCSDKGATVTTSDIILFGGVN